MDGQKIPSEMWKLWKSSWEGYLTALKAMQEQGDKMMDLMLQQGDTFQEEMKNAVKESAAKAKEMQQSYIQAIEDNIKKIDEMLESG